jgi:hypothetical protein
MMSFVAIPFSWLLCKDECIISYAMKKLENPHYALGNEPENVKDMSDWFVNPSHYMAFYHINHVLRMGSIVIVNHRTVNVPYSILVPMLSFYLYYNYDIVYRINGRKWLYPYFQMVLCAYLWVVFYKTVCV